MSSYSAQRQEQAALNKAYFDNIVTHVIPTQTNDENANIMDSHRRDKVHNDMLEKYFTITNPKLAKEDVDPSKIKSTTLLSIDDQNVLKDKNTNNVDKQKKKTEIIAKLAKSAADTKDPNSQKAKQYINDISTKS